LPLIPFRSTRWVEPMALLFTAGIALFGLVALREVVGLIREDAADTAVLIAGLATPVFAYARDFWTESWAACGVMIVLWLLLRNERSCWIALVTALTIWIRYPAVVVFVGLVAVGVVHRKRRIWAVGAGIAVATLTLMLYHKLLYATTLPPQGFFLTGNMLSGIVRSLIDPVHGLLVFSPVLAFGAVGTMGQLWACGAGNNNHPDLHHGLMRHRKFASTALASIAVMQFLLVAFYAGSGGSGYANRYLHAGLMPLAAACALLLPLRHGPVRAVFLVSLSYSVAINTLAGWLPGIAVDRSPWWMARHILQFLF
jgi:hypothetical protein